MTKPPVTSKSKPEGTADQLVTFLKDGRGMGMLGYALLFFMVLTLGATGIVALILLTFAETDKTPEWIKSHYQFQIRTFWIGIVPTLATVFLVRIVPPLIIAAVGKGQASVEAAGTLSTFLLVMPVLAWAAARCALGFNHLFYNRPYPNPKSWLV